MTVTGAIPGATYFLSVKYVPSSLRGEPAPANAKPTVHYTFQTLESVDEGVIYALLYPSTASVTVMPK